MVGALEADDPAVGVYQMLISDVQDYIGHMKPNILRYDIRTSTMGYPSLNFGVSKGMTFERVLIFPNKTFISFLVDPSKRFKAPDKYYVGVTRVQYSLSFVVEKFKPV
ncbi:hypothetical protein [Paenibacillus aquistagni]|uniref:hypothetical protein n=1 Tax=Paenibacillus aquistagni TaxID=1852522 RepID=UPI000B504E35|nr:hypothetical protein [Paenibacillus aquistagni]NMM55581.1 hypothetical protein [Paenibacillus aquistagni]